MADFDVKKFLALMLSSPDANRIVALKRPQLLILIKELAIELPSGYIRKVDLVDIATEWYIDEDILRATTVPSRPAESSLVETSQLVKLEELRATEAEKARKFEADEAEKVRNFEANEKEKARAHELVVRKAGGTPGTGRNSSIDVQRNIKLVPEFNEKEVDGFFLLFEKVADRLEWPSKIRTLLLQSVLKGKAQIVYAALDTSQCEDYDVVKREILKAYELVPEAYRRKFRDMSKGDGITYMDHARNLEIACDRWCVSRDIGEDFTKLRELVLVEQFKNKLPDSIKTFLDEKEINELKKSCIVSP